MYQPPDPDSLSRKKLARMIDYTMLAPDETVDSYIAFVKEADSMRFGCIFLPPCYVPLAAGMLAARPLEVGAPVAFPYGFAAPEVKSAECVRALEDGARELDVVINISAARSEDWTLVEEDLREVVDTVRAWEKALHRGPAVVKAILETPYLSDSQKKEVCRIAVETGADYVKTATGLGPGGATVEDVELMRRAVGDALGVKAAGGIRDWAGARRLISAGADRIGTSTGPAILEDFTRSRKG